jgi:hypothetical protein
MKFIGNKYTFNARFSKLERIDLEEEPKRAAKTVVKITYKDINIKHLFKHGFYFNSEISALEHIEARENALKSKKEKRMTEMCKSKFVQKKFWDYVTKLA